MFRYLSGLTNSKNCLFLSVVNIMPQKSILLLCFNDFVSFRTSSSRYKKKSGNKRKSLTRASKDDYYFETRAAWIDGVCGVPAVSLFLIIIYFHQFSSILRKKFYFMITLFIEQHNFLKEPLKDLFSIINIPIYES